jgi:hypothetical protein
MVIKKVMVHLKLVMEVFMKVNLKKIKLKDMDTLHGRMELNMKVFGRMIK